MKKLSIILLAALALTASSCQDEKTSAEPTVNPQLPIMTAQDLAVTTSVAPNVDLIEANASNTPITLATVDVMRNVPADYTLKFVGTIAREAEYEHTADFDVTLSADNKLLVVAPDALEAAYVSALGKSAKPKDVFFRIAAYAVNGEAQVRIGGPDYYVCEGTTNVTPLDLGIVIENSYGLLGTCNGWSVANALPMHNSGVSGYDDPVFKILVNISVADAASGWWWKVIPQSTIDAGDWVDAADASFGPAVNGDPALEGSLIGRTATTDSQAGCIKVPGVYMLVIDMENQSYEFERQFDFLWVCGDPDWDHNTAPVLEGAVDGTVFKGFAYLDGYFKLTSAPDWNGVNYGLDESAAGKLSTEAGADNLEAPKAALYYLTADIEKLTYTMNAITSCGLIGDFNSWSAQQALTPSANKLVWTGSLTLQEGQGFKVRFNDNWDINLGGDLNNLTVGGPNITVPAGTYQVTLDLSKVPYTLTLK